MTIKEAILKSLEELKKLSTHTEVYSHLTQNKYYEFTKSKTPESKKRGDESLLSLY